MASLAIRIGATRTVPSRATMFPSKKTSFRGRMRSDGLGDTTRGDRQQIGRGADRDAVIADTQSLRPGGADQVEGDLHPRIAPEVAFPPDNRRPFQQVGGAVGRPGVTDVVIAGKDQYPGGAQHLDRRQVSPPAP